MKEYVEKLEGVPEDVIAIRRAQRMATEERLMVQEVREKGRLLNMPILRKVRTPSQRLAIEAAALAVTDDNFDPDKADRRPLAWQAVKLRRVVTKEDIYRRQGSTEEEIATMREKLLVEVHLIPILSIVRDHILLLRCINVFSTICIRRKSD